MSLDQLPRLHTGCATAVRLITPGAYDPETGVGDGALERPCRALNCSADGTISFYDWTETLTEDYAVKHGENHIAIKALVEANITVWALY